MFNRAFQVRMVKNDKDETDPPNQTDKHLEGKAAIIGFHLERAVAKIGGAVIVYVAVDTVRQVMVIKARK